MQTKNFKFNYVSNEGMTMLVVINFSKCKSKIWESEMYPDPHGDDRQRNNRDIP